MLNPSKMVVLERRKEIGAMEAPPLAVLELQADLAVAERALVMAVVVEVDTPVVAKAVAAVARTTSETTRPTVEPTTDTAT